MAQLDKIRLSGTTYDIIDATALHTLDDNVTSGGTNAVKGSGIYNAITAATGALAETIAEQHYQTSGDVQSAISGKADAASAVTDFRVTYTPGKGQIKYGLAKNGTFGTDTIFAQFNSGLTLNEYGQVGIDGNVVAVKSDIPSVSGYADSVKYNSTSKYVEFYHGGTGGTKVFEYDASPFLIDGMVQNVEIKDVVLSGETVTCLVITFNTDAGKQDINIPISEIFDASNYYTKTEVDSMTKVSKPCWEEVEFTFDNNKLILSEGVENGRFTISGSDYQSWNLYGDTIDSDWLGMIMGTPGSLTKYGDAISIVSQGADYIVLSFTRPIMSIVLGNTNPITKVEKQGTCPENINTALEEFSASTNSALANKADTSAVTASIDAAVSGKVDTTAFTAYSGSVETALSGKQETLVSGTNIKTVGGNSLLGSGNIDWPAGMTASVSGTTLIFG